MAASQSGVFVAGALEQSQAAWDWVLPAIRSSKTRGPNFGEPCGQFKVWSKTVIQFCHFVLSRTCNYISLMMMMMMMIIIIIIMMMMLVVVVMMMVHPDVHPSIHQSMNHSINQSIDRPMNQEFTALRHNHSQQQHHHHHWSWSHGHDHNYRHHLSLCHCRFWKKASADSFDIVGVGRHFENDIWIYYTYLWDRLCKSGDWIQSDFHSSLSASHALKRTGCKQGIRLSSHGASAQSLRSSRIWIDIFWCTTQDSFPLLAACR